MGNLDNHTQVEIIGEDGEDKGKQPGGEHTQQKDLTVEMDKKMQEKPEGGEVGEVHFWSNQVECRPGGLVSKGFSFHSSCYALGSHYTLP